MWETVLTLAFGRMAYFTDMVMSKSILPPGQGHNPYLQTMRRETEKSAGATYNTSCSFSYKQTETYFYMKDVGKFTGPRMIVHLGMR